MDWGYPGRRWVSMQVGALQLLWKNLQAPAQNLAARRAAKLFAQTVVGRVRFLGVNNMSRNRVRG